MGLKVTAPVRIDISGGWPDSDPYRRDFGGFVLNVAIDRRVSARFEENNLITSNVPMGSGLGTSGALRACYLVASNPSLMQDKNDLVRRVWFFENQVLKHRAGFQDQAAAIYGRVNLWEFSAGDYMGEGVNFPVIKRTQIEKDKAKHLEDRIVIVYTGKDHLSANIHDLVFGQPVYEKNISKLDRMKAISLEMKESIDDEDKMADLINETWELQKSLHESIETSAMKQIAQTLRGEYLALRATGAGGGGAMILYGDREKILAALRNVKDNLPEVNVLDFKFEYEGIRIESS